LATHLFFSFLIFKNKRDMKENITKLFFTRPTRDPKKTGLNGTDPGVKLNAIFLSIRNSEKTSIELPIGK
jgi:hypothetical protein